MLGEAGKQEIDYKYLILERFKFRNHVFLSNYIS